MISLIINHYISHEEKKKERKGKKESKKNKQTLNQTKEKSKGNKTKQNPLLKNRSNMTKHKSIFIVYNFTCQTTKSSTCAFKKQQIQTNPTPLPLPPATQVVQVYISLCYGLMTCYFLNQTVDYIIAINA